MRGEQHKLKRRLESLQKAAAAGNGGAAGEARLLAAWLDDQEATVRKRQNDRCKVLVGAFVGASLSVGRSVILSDQRGLLNALSTFLVRPAEREAVLGEYGNGSEAFHRVFGAQGLGHKQSEQVAEAGLS